MGIANLFQRAIGRRPLGRKNFQGNLFDRFSGLDPLLERARGKSVLDLGMSEGHIAYEFARRGASTVHGLEQHRDKVRFAARLFRDVPVPNQFWRADLAISGERFEARYGSELLPRYDIVLFLGVYHHLKKQMDAGSLATLVDALVARAGTWFAARSDALPEFERRILGAGLVLDYEAPKEKIGLLRVYRRPD